MATEPKVYPYDDEFMIFDETVGMYVLTSKAAEELGFNLSVRLRQKGAVNAEIVARNTLRQISVMIYQYLHGFVSDENLQDEIIAKCPSVRPVMRRALEQQLLYFLTVGDLSRSTDTYKRALAIDQMAQSILNRRIPELGHSLTYSGSWRKWCNV